MPCTITDKIGYRTAAGVHTAIPNLPVYAVPGLSALTFDTGGTYRPNAARNPLIVGNPALDHGQIAITDGSGQFSLTLPYATETHPSSPEPYWTILFPDGQMVSGVVPSAAGPLLIDDLIESHGWAWSSSIYVVPVSPGAKARGVASFTGSSARVSILFSPSFASAPAEITIASSIDANTGEPMSVSCDLVTTTGFDLVAKDAVYVGSVYWTASV